MSTFTQETLRGALRLLARRHGWQLAPDEDVFLREAAAELAAIAGAHSDDARALLAVKRAYSARLHNALVRREERAAAEIWQAIWQIARRQGWDRVVAQDIAQATVLGIIAGIDGGKLQSPQMLLWWQFWVYRDVAKRQRAADARFVALTDDDEEPPEISDPADLAEAVETRVVGGQLFDLLARELPEPDLTIVLRSFAHDEKPQQIAHALGMKVELVRLRKCRALARLRSLDAVKRQLRELSGQAGVAT